MRFLSLIPSLIVSRIVGLFLLLIVFLHLFFISLNELISLFINQLLSINNSLASIDDFELATAGLAHDFVALEALDFLLSVGEDNNRIGAFLSALYSHEVGVRGGNCSPDFVGSFFNVQGQMEQIVFH